MKKIVFCFIGFVLNITYSQTTLDTSDPELLENFKYYTTPGGLYLPSQVSELPGYARDDYSKSETNSSEEYINVVIKGGVSTASEKNSSSTFSSVVHDLNSTKKPISSVSTQPSSHVLEVIDQLRDL